MKNGYFFLKCTIHVGKIRASAWLFLSHEKSYTDSSRKLFACISATPAAAGSWISGSHPFISHRRLGVLIIFDFETEFHSNNFDLPFHFYWGIFKRGMFWWSSFNFVIVRFPERENSHGACVEVYHVCQICRKLFAAQLLLQ